MEVRPPRGGKLVCGKGLYIVGGGATPWPRKIFVIFHMTWKTNFLVQIVRYSSVLF